MLNSHPSHRLSLLRAVVAASAVLFAGATTGCVADADDAAVDEQDQETGADAVSATFTGDATHYSESPSHVGACYPKTISFGGSAPLNGAMNHQQFASRGACGKLVQVTAVAPDYANPSKFISRSVTVRITNECPECKVGDIDFTDAAWNKLFPGQSPGRHKMKWHFQ